MKLEEGFAAEGRSLKTETYHAEFAVIGGGLSGVCTAITAARRGVKVVLIQDRPVLGGNSSSEVRLWILGATSHLGNNNRWSREGGVIGEILVENTYRNKEGNPLIFDTILLDKVSTESNITLLLNTAVYEVNKSEDDIISYVKGFCSQNSTTYKVHAPIFCDSSGDGVVAFLSGAAFRMGAEREEEFGEKFAPTQEYGELLGHSMYFYTKDSGHPVKYTAPEFAIDVSKQIPKFRKFNAKEHGCQLWWLEHGGRMDTVYDTEQIKWDLWKVIYGAWDYIKNSGNYPEAETLTLEWVGTIPGKRESRRFEGDYMLRQQDIVEQHEHQDAVAYGGWSIDLHPADGVFSEKPGCNQWHAKGIYQIPYRCLYSKNIKNLFIGGRLISATHVAFASTRVMATAAHIGQAIGMAAYIAINHSQNLNPADILKEGLVPKLQKELLKTGQHIPKFELKDDTDLVQHAKLNASSNFELSIFNADFALPIDTAVAQMLPLEVGKIPDITVEVDVAEATELAVELRISSRRGNYTPDLTLETKKIPLEKGRRKIKLSFSQKMPERAYAFLTFHKNSALALYRTHTRLTGVLTTFNLINKAVSNFGKQTPPDDIGMETFEFWCPQRRPDGHNLALQIEPALNVFGVEQIKTGVYRPTTAPNAWVSSLEDTAPQVKISWDEPQEIRYINLFFDTDYDHPMESVLMGHPEDVMPFCVRNYKILDDQNRIIYKKEGNYQSMNQIELDQPIMTRTLTVMIEHPSSKVPASLFSIRCYS